MDLPRGEPRCPLFHQEAPNSFVGPRPNHCNISYRPIGNPQLAPIQNVVIAPSDSLRYHTFRVGSVVGLGEAEAPDLFPLGKARKPLLLLRLCPKGVDRIHDERPLDGCEASEPTVPSFELLHDQSVSHFRDSRTPVTLKVGSQDSQLA